MSSRVCEAKFKMANTKVEFLRQLSNGAVTLWNLKIRSVVKFLYLLSYVAGNSYDFLEQTPPPSELYPYTNGDHIDRSSAYNNRVIKYHQMS